MRIDAATDPAGPGEALIENAATRRQIRFWYVIPWLVGLAFVGSFLALPTPAVALMGPWLFLAGVVLLGIPHGAADWWVARRTLPPRWFPGLFFVGYLALVGLVLVAWPLSPTVALGLFVVLTAWHWGSAELWVLPAGGMAARSWDIAQSFGRGGWVMLAPFAAHPDVTQELLLGWGMGWEVAIPRAVLVFGFLLCWAMDFAGAGRRSPKTVFRQAYLAETLVLGMAAWLLPPLWWVALYFLGFHSWRHLLRLQWTADPMDRLGSLLSLATVRFAPLVVISVLLGLVVVMVRGEASRWDPLAWSGSFVILLAALTVPHAVLIGYWEGKGLRAEGGGVRT